MKPFDVSHQLAGQEVADAGWHTHIDETGGQTVGRLHFSARLLELLHDTALAHEERRAEILFEQTHLARDGRLHYVKKLGSLRSTAAFSNGQESLQLFEINGLGGMGLQGFILVHVCGIRIGPSNLSHRITSCGEASHLVSVIDPRENPLTHSKNKGVKRKNKKEATLYAFS